MAVQLWKFKTVYAKIEASPGQYVTDAVLFAAANVLIAPQDITFESKPVIHKRKPEGKFLEGIQHSIGQIPASVKFSHRCFSGAAGVAPSYGPFLKACSRSETIVASTSVAYAPDPTQQVTLSIGWEILSEDGVTAYRYAMSGVKGTATLKAASIGAPLMWSYEFEGALGVSADGTTIYGTTATPTTGITYPDEVATAIRFGQFGSPAGIFAYQCDSLEVAFGNKVAVITDTTNANGLAYAVIDDQDPTIKAGYRVVPRATADELGKFVLGTAFANSVTFGATAGKRMTISTNASAQYSALAYKAIGPAAGMEATIDCHKTTTAAASSDSLVVTFL